MFEDVKGRLSRLERADDKTKKMFVFYHKDKQQPSTVEELKLMKKYPNALFVITREKDKGL